MRELGRVEDENCAEWEGIVAWAKKKTLIDQESGMLEAIWLIDERFRRGDEKGEKKKVDICAVPAMMSVELVRYVYGEGEVCRFDAATPPQSTAWTVHSRIHACYAYAYKRTVTSKCVYWLTITPQRIVPIHIPSFTLYARFNRFLYVCEYASVHPLRLFSLLMHRLVHPGVWIAIRCGHITRSPSSHFRSLLPLSLSLSSLWFSNAH